MRHICSYSFLFLRPVFLSQHASESSKDDNIMLKGTVHTKMFLHFTLFQTCMTSVEHENLNVYINIECPAHAFQYEWMRTEAVKLQNSKKKHHKNIVKVVHMTCMLKIFTFTLSFLAIFSSDIRFVNESFFSTKQFILFTKQIWMIQFNEPDWSGSRFQLT